MKKDLLLAVCSAFLLIAPLVGGQALAVGSVTVTSDWPSSGGELTINGTFGDGIQLTLNDVGTGQSFTVTSAGEAGWFSFHPESDHSYQLVKVYLKITNSQGASAWVQFVPSSLIFNNMAKGVTNLGHVVCTANHASKRYFTTLEPAPLAFGAVTVRSNWPASNGQMTVNGVFGDNVQLTFNDMNTGQPLTATASGAPGWFYFRPQIDHRYQLAKVYLRLTNAQGGWAAVQFVPSSIVFDGLPDGVTNLGHVVCTADHGAQRYVTRLEPVATSAADVALLTAAQSGTPDDVRRALRDGANVEAINERTGNTPLHLAACCNTDSEVVRTLLSAGADLEARNTATGSTPLNLAVYANSNPEVVSALLAQGADVIARNNYGNSVLDSARTNAALKNTATLVHLALIAAAVKTTPAPYSDCSLLVFKNKGFAPILMNVNGYVAGIAPGKIRAFLGAPGADARCVAISSETTRQGDAVGQVLSWDVTLAFPSSGISYHNLTIISKSFFLRIKKDCTPPITRIYVNYSLKDQVVANVTLSEKGTTYDVGYFPAFSNSNVRLETASGTHWDWNTLNLPFEENQAITLTPED